MILGLKGDLETGVGHGNERPPLPSRSTSEREGHFAPCSLWSVAAPCVSRRAVSLFSVLTRSCVICFHIYQDY